MSKKKSNSPEKISAKPKIVQTKAIGSPTSLTAGFDRLDESLSYHRKKIFYSLCFLTALFSVLLFNIRLSEGSDDSSYIYAGYKYSKNFLNYFYSNNAPLYPIFLSIPIKLFGIDLVLLKLTSFIFYFFSFLFFFKAFDGRIPYVVLLPALVFYAISSSLQYYASQTYNEAFFLFFQSLFIFSFFKLLDKIKDSDEFISFKKNWRSWLVIGLLAAMISLVKNLGVMVFPLVILFFLLQKQWKHSIIAAFVLLSARFSFDLLKTIIWGNISQFSAQSETLLYKDPYSPEKGTEDLAGVISRFFGNCEIYLSNRIPQIFGFQDESYRDVSGFLSLIIIALFVTGLFYIFKNKNNWLLFTWLYIGGSVFVSFVVLQHTWAQTRMIVIHIPLLILILFYALYKLFSRFKIGYIFYGATAILLFGSLFISSFKKISHNYPILVKNMKGDKYYGYTPDWQHFLKMSKWCADSLPENTVVVSRKAAMSFIYSNGKEFFPINSVLFYDAKTGETDPDSVLWFCKKNKIQYFMLASLRYYPLKKTSETVNTLEVFLNSVVHKYPDKVVYVRSEGEKDDEPCFLYEIKY